MFNRIMYATLFVKDQNKALDFYTKILRFEKRADYAGPEGRFLTIGFQGQQPEVLLWPDTQGHPTDSAGSPPSATPGPPVIESDNLRKDFERLRSEGITFAEAEPESYPFGVRVTALDPDRNRVSRRQSHKS